MLGCTLIAFIRALPGLQYLTPEITGAVHRMAITIALPQPALESPVGEAAECVPGLAMLP